MAATEQVILVDENDHFIGTAEKLQAHREGLCHRAFSVFIFHNGLLLLQQRAKEKYHSPNLWTVGTINHTEITLNEREVQAYRWIAPSELHKELFHSPEQFTPWLRQALKIAENFFKEK